MAQVSVANAAAGDAAAALRQQKSGSPVSARRMGDGLGSGGGKTMTAAQFIAEKRDHFYEKSLHTQAIASARSPAEGQRLHAEGQAALASATHKALVRASLQSWPILDGERKLGFKTALAGISLDPALCKQIACGRCRASKQKVLACADDEVRVAASLFSAQSGEIGTFSMSRSRILEARVSGSPEKVCFVRESSQLLRVLLEPASANAVRLDEDQLLGTYRISVTLPSSMCGGRGAASQTFEDLGAYDFTEIARSHSQSVPAFACRIPLYSRDVLASKIASLELPVCEMHLVLARDGARSFRVAQAELAIFLKPNPQWLTRRWHVAPLGSLADSGLFDAFCESGSEQELRQAQCATRSSSLRTQLEDLISNYLGRVSQEHTYRLVAYQGTLQVASATNEHQEFHYRLGGASEIFTALAVVRHIVRESPCRWSRVSLHDASVLEYFLKRSGATRILAALRQVYACVGDGSLPTLFQLLNHTSGLPDLLPVAPPHIVKGLLACDPLKPTADEMLAREFDSCEGDADKFEARLAEGLERGVVPLFEPGTRFHHSSLGYALLRFVFRDWRQPEAAYGMRNVLDTCRDLGIVSASISLAGTRCAQGCRLMPLEPALYTPAMGLLARPEEVALALSDRNPWRGACADPALCASYAFLSRTLLPRAVVSPGEDVYFSYGWFNVPIQFGGSGASVTLRALYSVGCLDRDHLTVLCMLPSASLSFCFATTAPIACFVPDAATKGGCCSLRHFVRDALEILLRGISQLDGVGMRKALVFSPEINAQLAAPPESDHELAAHSRHAARLDCVFASRLENLDRDYVGEYVSLVDELVAYARSGGGLRLEPRHTLSIRYVPLEASALEGCREAPGLLGALFSKLDSRQAGVYVLEERSAGGVDVVQHTLAHDPIAFCDPVAARACRASQQQQQPRAGSYRVIHAQDGLPGEYLTLAAYRLARPERGCREREPIVCFHGKIFVRPELFEAIRRRVIPSEQEKSTYLSLELSRSIAASVSSQQQQQPQSSVPTTSLSRANGGFASKLVGQLLDAAPPSTRPSEAGLGVGGGVALGALGGFALGATLASRPPYAYPVYEPVPVYRPVVVYPRRPRPYYYYAPRHYY